MQTTIAKIFKHTETNIFETCSKNFLKTFPLFRSFRSLDLFSEMDHDRWFIWSEIVEIQAILAIFRSFEELYWFVQPIFFGAYISELAFIFEFQSGRFGIPKRHFRIPPRDSEISVHQLCH